MAAAASHFHQLRVPCPRGEGTGPAAWCCSHLRLVEGGPTWRVIPSEAGAWGFACDVCLAAFRAAASTAAGGDPDAVGAFQDVALRLLKPLCRHCIADVKGERFMTFAAACSDLLAVPHRCAACRQAPATIARGGRCDVEGLGVGTIVAALCDRCADADGPVAFDPESSRFLED